MSKGMILVAGEVEGERLPGIIEHVIRGRAERLYLWEIHPGIPGRDTVGPWPVAVFASTLTMAS